MDPTATSVQSISWAKDPPPLVDLGLNSGTLSAPKTDGVSMELPAPTTLGLVGAAAKRDRGAHW